MAADKTTDTNRIVEFSIGDAPPRTGRARAFHYQDATRWTGGRRALDPPAGAEEAIPPTVETLLAYSLGRDRRLLVDVSDMTKDGRQQASRRAPKSRVPNLFYFEGNQIYSAAAKSQLTLTTSAEGLALAADRCSLDRLKNPRAEAVSTASLQNRLVLSFSQSAPIAASSRKFRASKLDERLQKLNLGLEKPASGKRLGEPHMKANALLCAYFAYEVYVHTQTAAALAAQWWNPWAWLAAAYESYLAYLNYQAGRRIGCW